MGKRGPKPKPLAVRQLEGNLGRLPMPAPELTITSGLPVVMPAELASDPVARAEFERIVAAMPAGVYEALDTAALTLYALSWSMLWQAQRELDAHGVMIKLTKTTIDAEGATTTEETLKNNPALKTWNLAVQSLYKSVDRLGLVPGVRARLQLPERRAGPGRPPTLRPASFQDLMPEN